MDDHELSVSRSIGVPGWAAFRRAHLHDYSLAAVRFWLALALIGAFALVLSGVRLAQLDAAELWQILGWSAIAAIAAAFPIQIPRSKHSVATGDIVIFLLLALHGTPAAVLAAGLEGLVASSRSSARLSSPIASLCAAAVGMAVGGSLLDVAQPWLQANGLPHAAAHMAALAVAVLAYFMVSTAALMQIVCLKRGLRLTPKDWFDATSWVGALYLASAVLAGFAVTECAAVRSRGDGRGRPGHWPLAGLAARPFPAAHYRR